MNQSHEQMLMMLIKNTMDIIKYVKLHCMDKRDGPHLSQVHKINHAVYICDRMGRSKDLTEFECDTMKVFPSLLFQDQLLVVLLQRGSIWDT